MHDATAARCRAGFAAAGVITLLALPLRAADEGRPLTLDGALARALARNHDIAIEFESYHIASSAIQKADGSYDPSLRLDLRYRDHTDPVNSIFSGAPEGKDSPHQTSFMSSASVAQLLPTGGVVSLSTSLQRDHTNGIFTILSPAYTTSFGLELRQPILQNRAIDPARRTIRVARTERDRSAALLRRTVTETVAQVERAYWTLVAARRDVAVRRSSVTLADEQKADTKARIEAGTLPESDLAQPTAEVERRKGELYAAEESLRRAERQLKTLMLDDPADPMWAETIVPSDSPETEMKPVDLPAALETAGKRRPELTAAEAGVRRQEIDLEAARDRVLPQLDLVASYTRLGLAGSANPYAESFTGGPVTVPEPLDGGLGRSLGTVGENRFPDASIGLAFTVPIGNRAAKADAVAAGAARRQAALALAQQRQGVAVEVRNAATALETAAQRIEAARSGRLAAETQLNAEKERFGVGLSTNFFVLTRQNELAQAQVTETAALTDYRKALTELSRAAGTLLDERNVQVSEDAPAIRAQGGAH